MTTTKTSRALTKVYENDDFQITGISVSKTGRLFVNFPRWSDRYLHAVAEVDKTGNLTPYPDAQWNTWDLKAATAGEHFVCVQSVVVDRDDTLWVVDAAAPLLGPIVPGGPKLVQIDLATNTVARVIPIDSDIAKIDSYMNDIRIDTEAKTAYLTDSGHGGLIVVDLVSGAAHRALNDHPSMQIEDGVKVVVDGKELLQNGKPPQFKSDGIALSHDGTYLYYKAVTANTLYRIATDLLRDATTAPDALAAGVETVAQTFPTDGLWMTANGDLYLTDVCNDAVSCLRADGSLERVAEDAALQWPDTLSEGPDGAIYVSASQINNSPTFNEGTSVRTTPFAVFRFTP